MAQETTISFKPARPEDLELLLRFSRELAEHDGTPFKADRTRQALRNLIGRSDWGGVWLIYRQEQPVGYIVLTWGYSLEFGGRDAFIDELYLQAGYRGQGIGRQAIQFAQEQCLAHNICALHLEVERDNTGAQEFYRRAGFESRAHYFLMSKRWV